MSDIDEARSEAQAIVGLDDTAIANLFFSKAMKRNLSRTVRHLDKLVENGGQDRKLGESALQRLGFATQS